MLSSGYKLVTQATLTIFCAGPVDQDSAGRVAADQVVDEGQRDEEGCGRCSEGQTGQAFGKRRHQVRRQVTIHKHVQNTYVS